MGMNENKHSKFSHYTNIDENVPLQHMVAILSKHKCSSREFIAVRNMHIGKQESTIERA